MKETELCERCAFYDEDRDNQPCCSCEGQNFVEEETIQRAVEAFQAIWESIFYPFKKCIESVLRTYPNKRVMHLAMHHPKERVRKKNTHRIMRWMTRGGRR